MLSSLFSVIKSTIPKSGRSVKINRVVPDFYTVVRSRYLAEQLTKSPDGWSVSVGRAERYRFHICEKVVSCYC